MGGIRGALDVWGGGQLLAFSALDGPTDYADSLVLRTSASGTGLQAVLPGVCEVRIAETPPAQTLLAGDFFDLITAAGRVRGAFLDAHHLLLDGPAQPGPATRELAFLQRGGRTLLGARARFDPAKLDADLDAAVRARRRWLESVALPAGLAEPCRRVLVKALSVMKTQVCSPEGRIGHRWTTPDRWPHRGMWLWDSAFHAIGWRHVSASLAREMLDAVLDTQREDGMAPHQSDPQFSSPITQPPVLALAAMLVHQADPNPDWLARLYPKLRRYVEWDFAHRDRDGDGLLEWTIEDNPFCRCGESGMDNSTRFDAATPLNAVDFSAYIGQECERLSEIAETLGLLAEAEMWTDRQGAVCRQINARLWDAEAGLFVDRAIATDRQTGVLSAAGFLPLLCGAASARQAQRLADHLRDPATFGTPLPVATLAPKDAPGYAPDMWRGPVWVNLNWLIMRGFARYGMADVARRLRRATIEAVAQEYERYGVLFEYYDDQRQIPPPALLRKGRNDPSSPYRQPIHDYGWTATLLADLLLAREA